MIHNGVRHLFQTLGAVILGVLIVIPLLVWRLSEGPLPLDFLTPYIEASAQARDNSWHMNLDRTQLALGKGRHMIEFQILEVRFFTGSEQAMLSIPKISVSFNIHSLLGGILAPASLRLNGAKIHLVRDENGKINWGLGDAPPDANQSDANASIGALLIDSLIGDYDPFKPGRQLRELVVSNAEVTLEDRSTGVSWKLPNTNFSVNRTATGATLLGGITVEDPIGPAQITVQADYHHLKGFDGVGLWSTKVDFTALRLAPLSRLGPGFEVFSSLDVPVSGHIEGTGGGYSGDAKVFFDVAGGAGRLRLLDADATQYELAGLVLKGSYDWSSRHLSIAQLKANVVNGPTLGLTGTIDGVAAGDSSLSLALEGTYDNMAFDALNAMWPPSLAPNPREWIVANLSKGVVHDGVISLVAASKPGHPDDLDVQKVEGHFRADGVTVRYLPTMPLLRDVSGMASFDDKTFTIAIATGQVAGLKAKSGKVLFTDLDKPIPKADIAADATGSLADTMRLIDQKPFEYAHAVGIDPSVVGGDADIHLHLEFPLLKDVRLEDVAVGVHATVVDAKMPQVLAGLDLTQGHLVLDLDDKGMDVTGPIALGGIAAQLTWRQNFTAKAPFHSRYEIKATDVDVAGLKLFGLDTPPFTSPWMEGHMTATVVATASRQRRTDIAINADLTQARMSFPGLGWRKEERTTAGAKAQLVLEAGKLTDIPRFEVVAGDLLTDGAIEMGPNSHVRRITFNHLNYGRTNMDGVIDVKTDGAMAMSFRGASFDAEPLVSSDENDDAKPGDDESKPDPNAPMITLDAQFKRVWLSREGGVDDAFASLYTDMGDWRAVSVNGKVGTDHKDFKFTVTPQGPDKRVLKITSEDAGAMLRAFDVYDDLVGGTLSIDGSFADDKRFKPLTGMIKIDHFNVVHTPALAHLLTVASLTGVVDLLQGQGISFSSLQAPFELSEGRLRVHDAQTAGSALGLTANGDIDMKLGRLALEGTLVPFYSLNSVLGDVPGLGWLMTGGEKGGGLVAFNFSMKGPTNDPEVSINPLSALTPGFLRHFFDLFGSAKDTDTRK